MRKKHSFNVGPSQKPKFLEAVSVGFGPVKTEPYSQHHLVLLVIDGYWRPRGAHQVPHPSCLAPVQLAAPDSCACTPVRCRSLLSTLSQACTRPHTLLSWPAFLHPELDLTVHHFLQSCPLYNVLHQDRLEEVLQHCRGD